MQPKVSVVIPCYNKKKYIRNMFDSIILQKWDNIELILVNDGSTDGTREIISEYEQKFCTRGYEAIVIDQINQGLAASVYNGLLRVSGEYVCTVDADDELDPEYISTMAGWLSDNLDYDWAVCDVINVLKDKNTYTTMFPNGIDIDLTAESWLLRRVRWVIWVYMIRMQYLKNCNVLETFCTAREGTQEAQIFLPLIFGGGKIKYIQKPLYRYTYDIPNDHLSFSSTYNDVVAMMSGWYDTANKIINFLQIDDNTKNKLLAVSEYRRMTHIIMYMIDILDSPPETWNMLDALIHFIKSNFNPAPQIKKQIIKKYNTYLFWAVGDNILGAKPILIKPSNKRVIAWGALGDNANKMLPLLEYTSLKPTVLWDMAGDGIEVLKPDMSALTSDDIILVFPSIGPEIIIKLKSMGCTVLSFFDIKRYITSVLFPEFYDNSITFTPRKQSAGFNI